MNDSQPRMSFARAPGLALCKQPPRLTGTGHDEQLAVGASRSAAPHRTHRGVFLGFVRSQSRALCRRDVRMAQAVWEMLIALRPPFCKGRCGGRRTLPKTPQNTPKHPITPHNTPHPTAPLHPPSPPHPLTHGCHRRALRHSRAGLWSPKPPKKPPQEALGWGGRQESAGARPHGRPAGPGPSGGAAPGLSRPHRGARPHTGTGHRRPPGPFPLPPPRSGPAQRVSYPHSSWRRRPHCPHPRWRRRRRVTWPGGEVRRGGRRHVG